MWFSTSTSLVSLARASWISKSTLARLPESFDEDSSDEDCHSDNLPPVENSSESGVSEVRKCSLRSKSGELSKSEKKKAYKAKLSYRKQWKAKYPWVYCTDASQGMFCKLCQQKGKIRGEHGHLGESRTGIMQQRC